MSDLRKAAEMALKALESYPLPFQTYAKEALRQALDNPEIEPKVLVDMAVLAEREACAKVCEDMEEKAEEYGTECCKWPTPIDCACTIRARGER